MSNNLDKDLEALRSILAQRVEEMNAEQEAEIHEETLTETLQAEFSKKLSPDVVEGEVRSFLKSRQKGVPEEPRERVKKSLPLEKPFASRRVVQVAIFCIFAIAISLAAIGFVDVYEHDTQEEEIDFQLPSSTEIEKALTINHQPGSKRAEIIIAAPSQATEVILYENMRVLGRWGRGNNIELKTVVFHEEGGYIYFAEIYFGNEKMSTSQKRVDFGE